MTGYILSEDAYLDLEIIWDYIAKDSINAANRWIDKLFEAFDRIAKCSHHPRLPRHPLVPALPTLPLTSVTVNYS